MAIIPLRPGDIHVWYRETSALDDGAVAIAMSQITTDERVRADRFAFQRDRRDFAVAHALIRRALSMYADVEPLDWKFDVTPQGKPVISPLQAGVLPLTCNLSHTRGSVACAIARGVDVGVDVEAIGDRVDGRDIAARYFSPTEIAALDACAPSERRARFIEFWTLKEAYLKGTGQGLAERLDLFGFALEGSEGLRFQAPPGLSSEAWTFALCAPSTHDRLAVAARSTPHTCDHIAVRVAGEGELDADALVVPVLRRSASPRNEISAP